jgi:hypothetical protein
MSDRLPGSCWHNPIWHGKWRIYVSDDPFLGPCKYEYVHDDYDGADDANDNRAGYARTVDEAKQQIDEYEEDAR